MKEIGRNTRLLQNGGYFFSLLPVAYIHNGCSGYFVQHMYQLIHLVFRTSYYVRKIAASETFLKYVLFFKVKTFLNVIHHLGSCRGGKRQYRYPGQQLAYIGNGEVGGTEVVSPLRDTMAFVNYQQRHIHCVKLGFEQLCNKTFGRDVKKFIISENAILKLRYYLLTGHPGIYSRGLYPHFTQVVHLILHKGNQGSNHNAYPFHRHGWYLESNRFASAGRHQAKCIPARSDGMDDILLQRTKRLVSPVLL